MEKTQQTISLIPDTPGTTAGKGQCNKGVNLDAFLLFLCGTKHLAVTPPPVYTMITSIPLP